MRCIVALLSLAMVACAVAEGDTTSSSTTAHSDAAVYVPTGSCEYTDVAVSLDEAMGDGITARGMMEVCEGPRVATLEWYASTVLTDLGLELTFDDDSAVWREGIYIEPDGTENPTVDCGVELLLVADLRMESADGLLAETFTVDVRTSSTQAGRVDHEVEVVELAGGLADDLVEGTLDIAINISAERTGGQLNHDDGSEAQDIAGW